MKEIDMSLTATAPIVIERDGYVLTTHRAFCRRGVLWIGQTCNLRCHFCYFLDKIMDKNHPEHDFFALDKLKAMCKTLVDVYGNNSVDIQGGEPTIYRHITELMRYCNEIGLKPTLITNGQVLAELEKVPAAEGSRRLRPADQRPRSWSALRQDRRRQRRGGKAAEGDRQRGGGGIPFRFNCVLCTDALPDLLGVARLAVAEGARAVNFIAFNPFIDQACGGKRSAENVPKYSEVVDYLIPAIDLLDANGIEVNVRVPAVLPLSGEVPQVRAELPADRLRPPRMGSRRRSLVESPSSASDAGAAQRADRLLPPHRNASAELLQPGTRAAVRGTAMGTVGGAPPRRDRRARAPLTVRTVALFGSVTVGSAIREAASRARPERRSHLRRVHLVRAVSHRFRH